MPSAFKLTVEAHEGKLICHMCGQVWLNRKQHLGDMTCPGPTIWGTPQLNRSWLVPPGTDIQWESHKVHNTGPQGHKLQWYKGVLRCGHCGAWTARGERPKNLVQPCPGK
eukprot:6357472-Karenia_brevis.AAC.1